MKIWSRFVYSVLERNMTRYLQHMLHRVKNVNVVSKNVWSSLCSCWTWAWTFAGIKNVWGQRKHGHLLSFGSFPDGIVPHGCFLKVLMWSQSMEVSWSSRNQPGGLSVVGFGWKLRRCWTDISMTESSERFTLEHVLLWFLEQKWKGKNWFLQNKYFLVRMRLLGNWNMNKWWTRYFFLNVQIDFIFSWLTFVDPQNFSINSSV